MSEIKKVAIYVRVSTVHQIDKDSLPFQREQLTNYCKYVLGVDDYEIFEDAGYSAKNTDRPKYQNMITRIEAGEFTHLLVWKIDRISRNLKDFTEMYENLKVRGITFISKNESFDTSTAMGEAMLKIILVFAELERNLTAERVFSIMLSRAEKGQWNGATVPLGYQWSEEEKFPIIYDEEATTVRYIYSLYEDVRSTSKVALKLNAEQVKTKRNGKWTAKTINDILKNPFYIGTYRYNYKTGGSRRIKDEKEWVLVENNHPGIIIKEQFDRVNQMLTDNFRGDYTRQRSNKHTHILSRMIYCGRCGSNFVAGLDSKRKDGYKPSRYTCYSVNYEGNTKCSAFVSDIMMLPFLLNYIANFINLQNRVNTKHSLRDIESILLRGPSFENIESIDRKGLESTFLLFTRNVYEVEFDGDNESKPSTNIELEQLKKEKTKYEKALQRLEDLFLFSDEAMAKKDFLFKKRDLVNNLETINDKIQLVYKQSSDVQLNTDVAFLDMASHFLITQQLISKRNIEYRDLLNIVDASVIRDFIQSIIKKISVKDKMVEEITFQNGITHRFLYKPVLKQKHQSKTKFLYRTFEPMLIEYLEKNKSASRVEVENALGLTKHSAGVALKEFTERGIVEKRGSSVAIRYYYVEKEGL